MEDRAIQPQQGEKVARGSIGFQVKRFLDYKKVEDSSYCVTFPRYVGKGRFVDVHVAAASMTALAETPLIYRGARLQRHLENHIVSKTAFVVEVKGLPKFDDPKVLATAVAAFLQPYAQVHDIWIKTYAYQTDENIVRKDRLAS